MKAIGRDLSVCLYRPGTDTSAVADQIQRLEQQPPDAPPPLPAKPRRERVGASLSAAATAMRANGTATGLALLGAGALLLIGYSAVTADKPLAYADTGFQELDEKPEFANLIDADLGFGNEEASLQTCLVYRYEGEAFSTWQNTELLSDSAYRSVSYTTTLGFADDPITGDPVWFYMSEEHGIAELDLDHSEKWGFWEGDWEVEDYAFPDLGSLSEIALFHSPESITDDGFTVRTHYFGSDWYVDSESVPEFFVSHAYIDDAPWSLREWVAADGSVVRFEMHYTSLGVQTWRQGLFDNTPGYECPVDSLAVADRFAQRNTLSS